MIENIFFTKYKNPSSTLNVAQASRKSYRCHKLGRAFLHNDPYLIYHNIPVVDAIDLEIIMHQ